MKEYNTNIPKISLLKEDSNFKKCKIAGSKDAYEYMIQFYDDDIELYESFFLLLLNRANNTIGYAKISQGGVSGTVADPRLIAKYAVESLCSSVILGHNHPSGSLTPSKNDFELTTKIKKGLLLFDIPVLDHIILSKKEHYSFSDAQVDL